MRRAVRLVILRLAAGTAPADGTVLWTAAEADPTVPARATVLRAVPTGEEADAAPALFFVDEGSAWAGAVLARPAGRATRIRATTIEGRLLWARTLSDLAPYDGLVRHVAADPLGGLVLVLGSTYNSPEAWPQRVQRLEGLTGQIAWEYFANDGALSEVAIHPDGRVFVVDEAYHTADTDLVALDAETGAPQRWRLPWGEYQAFATGPIVREDGTVVLLANPHDTCWSDTTTDLRLLALHPDTGTLATTSVAGWPGGCYFDPAEHRLLPDGGDGLLVAHRREGRVRHLDAAGTLSAETTLLPPSLASDGIEAEYVLGENAAYALVKRYANETYTAYEVAFDPLTLAVASYADRPGAPALNLRFALAGGGTYASGPTGGRCQSSDTQVLGGLWSGWGVRPLLCADDTEAVTGSAWPRARGGSNSRNAVNTTYSTADSAAVAVLQEYNPSSILRNRELGGSVCGLATGRFAWSVPNMNEIFTDTVVPSDCSAGVPWVGRYHTHGRDGNDGFSGPDIANADANPGKVWYVATPCGHIDKCVGPGAVVYVRLPERTETWLSCHP